MSAHLIQNRYIAIIIINNLKFKYLLLHYGNKTTKNNKILTLVTNKITMLVNRKLNQ